MTNDPTTNQIKVYDGGNRALLQTLATRGKGGVRGSARGVKNNANGAAIMAANAATIEGHVGGLGGRPEGRPLRTGGRYDTAELRSK